MRLSPASLLLPLLTLGLPGLRAQQPAAVTVAQDQRSFTLANDVLSVRIGRQNGRVESLRFQGRELLKGGGYWSVSARGEQGRFDGFGVADSSQVTIDPATCGGDRAEVSCAFHGGDEADTFPGRQEVRYALGRGGSVLYAYAILRHGRGDSSFGIGEGRFVLKLNPAVFDHFTVDAARRRVMPTGADWDNGTQLNLKEVRRLTTGIHAGLVEHKYGYSAMLGGTPAYGWSGTKSKLGVWMINPSVEYIAGGPTKMELTGHLDVNKGGTPTLLNMWHGSHYGGSSLAVARDEPWTRVIGPFVVLANQGADPDGLWQDALAVARREAGQWPYAWVAHPDYPPVSGRGAVAGRLVVRDPVLPATPPGPAWVGLSAPDSQAGERRRPRETIGWQRDGKHYQYWARASTDGRFTVRHVRPGTYVLRAFSDGVLGELARAYVTVSAGGALDLGDVVWQPVRYGRTLWEIGIPDRSGAEFRNGDRYWLWGHYLRYSTEFPHDVDFTVGKSDWRKDWNYCQPPRLDPKSKVTGESTWRIRFPMDKQPDGEAVLRLSLCGFRADGELVVTVNGATAGSTGPFPENGVMHRDGIRGYWREFPIRFPARLLKPGENVIALRSKAWVWHQGVVYDYLRLELDETHASEAKL